MQSNQPVSVLIVEDEVLVRLELVDLIEDAGFKVYEASNADEAIQIMEVNTDIKILITDVDMPGSMDGLKLSHFVRDRWPPVRIVVASGHVRVKSTELPEQGVFLNKPYEMPRIRELLSSITGQLANNRAGTTNQA